MSEQEKQYENMTLEEMLDLGVDDIEVLKGFQVPPEGIYSGVMGEWELPEEKNSNAFIQEVAVTGIVELEDEALTDPSNENFFEVKEDTTVQARYFKGSDYSIQAMRTNWEQAMIHLGGGNLGGMIANSNGAEIIFRIEHRYQLKDSNGKKLPKPKGPFAEIKDVQMVGVEGTEG